MSKQETTSAITLDSIVSLAKRRGFVFQSSEIYGGLNGCWDYGPLGVELLRNIKEAWWRAMTYRDDIEGLDASILMHPRVWEASGHVSSFSDPQIDCRSCKTRYRVDTFFEEMASKRKKELLKAFVHAASGKENLERAYALVRIGAKDLFETERRENWGDQERKDEILAVLNKLDEGAIASIYDHIKDDQELGAMLITLPETVCPNCGTKGSFTVPRQFNLMFKTYIGPVEDTSAIVYLRPETAQGIFVNFNNVLQCSRQRIPFGIAQIGKSFRNEINTKNFLFRTREFEQMEMQFFVKPGEDDRWFDFWLETRWNWFRSIGMRMEKLRTKPHEKLAHYAKAAIDIEYEFPFGWGEIEGIHNRTDFDLGRHTEFSGKKLEYYDDASKERYIPYVIETAIGASRTTMAVLVDAYNEEEVNGEKRTVLKFHPTLSPYKLAILPLVNKDGMPEFATKLQTDVQRTFKSFYDDSGAVGRRYRRQDEIGTPFCATIDGQTLEDGTVTIRERDSMEQIRIPADNVKGYVLERVSL